MKRVKIGYKNYSLAPLSEKHAREECIYGDTNHETAAIRVRTEGVQNQEIMNTLIHEILHGCCSVFNIYDGEKQAEEEERVVTMLSNALATIFIDNPVLIKQLEDLRK